MRRLSTLLDFALWPALLTTSCLGLAWGMACGRGPLTFNLVCLCLAGTLPAR